MRQQTDIYRHIDWATYGLCCLERLFERTGKTDKTLSDVFTSTFAYSLHNRSCHDCTASLQDHFIAGDIGLLTLWSAHKQASAGLRYAYLSGLDVFRITVNTPGAAAASAPRVGFHLSDGSHFYLQRLDDQCLAQAGQVVLQGGNPADWYNLVKWSQIRPLSTDQGPLTHYPLSLSSYCDPRFRDVLANIGAFEATDSCWYPPPGTSSDDMHHYLQQHSIVARAIPEFRVHYDVQRG